MKLKPILISILILLFLIETRGQSVKGGEINLKRISQFNFEATAKLIVNWPNTLTISYVKINWGDGSPLDSLPYFISGCNQSGSEVLIFKGIHSFLANNVYTISIQNDFLVNGITNIPNSGTQKLTLKHILNTNIYNSPPTFSFCLNDSVPCSANNFFYVSGFTETDGDSISYSIANHAEFFGYEMPPVGINSISGILTFTASASGRYNISVKIDEWRQSFINGPYNIIGSTYRELFISVCNLVLGNNNQSINNSFILYPNPVINKLIISNPNFILQQNNFIQITNTIGQTVYSNSLNSTENQIELGHLQNGVYFIKIINNQNQKTFKIIKN